MEEKKINFSNYQKSSFDVNGIDNQIEIISFSQHKEFYAGCKQSLGYFSN